jgi:hypothetical protein
MKYQNLLYICTRYHKRITPTKMENILSPKELYALNYLQNVLNNYTPTQMESSPFMAGQYEATKQAFEVIGALITHIEIKK